MTYKKIIIKVRKPEVVYVHVMPCEEDQWYCTYSRFSPCSTWRLGRFYHRPPKGRDNSKAVLGKYVKILERYYR